MRPDLLLIYVWGFHERNVFHPEIQIAYRLETFSAKCIAVVTAGAATLLRNLGLMSWLATRKVALVVNVAA